MLRYYEKRNQVVFVKYLEDGGSRHGGAGLPGVSVRRRCP